MPIISTCKQCAASFSHNSGTKRKFCSSSCSATFNNTGRMRSEESRKRTGASVRRWLESHYNSRASIPRDSKGRRLYQVTCVSCNGTFLYYNPTKKSCSDECLHAHMSSKRIRYLKENAGTFNWIRKGKMNYVETCFNDWLIENGLVPKVDFVALGNVVHNHEKNTSYIMDFWFPQLKLNIELDGTHHLRDEQQLRDSIRDEYLSRVHGITILRIKVRDWNNRRLRDIIKSELMNGALERSRTSMCPITVSPP